MGKDGHEHHLMSLKMHLQVIGALFFLTFITVWVAQFDTGVLHTPIALVIATVKALLVIAYFMHLRWDSNMNRALFGSTFILLFLLGVIVVLDILTRVDPRL